MGWICVLFGVRDRKVINYIGWAFGGAVIFFFLAGLVLWRTRELAGTVALPSTAVASQASYGDKFAATAFIMSVLLGLVGVFFTVGGVAAQIEILRIQRETAVLLEARFKKGVHDIITTVLNKLEELHCMEAIEFRALLASPAFGMFSSPDVVCTFVDFLEEWLLSLRRRKGHVLPKPTMELVIWPSADHRSRFGETKASGDNKYPALCLWRIPAQAGEMVKQIARIIVLLQHASKEDLENALHLKLVFRTSLSEFRMLMMKNAHVARHLAVVMAFSQKDKTQTPDGNGASESYNDLLDASGGEKRLDGTCVIRDAKVSEDRSSVASGTSIGAQIEGFGAATDAVSCLPSGNDTLTVSGQSWDCFITVSNIEFTYEQVEKFFNTCSSLRDLVPVDDWITNTEAYFSEYFGLSDANKAKLKQEVLRQKAMFAAKLESCDGMQARN